MASGMSGTPTMTPRGSSSTDAHQALGSRFAFWLKPAALILTACCAVACHAAIDLRGTVTRSDVSDHSFDEAPNPRNEIPVQGARLSLYVTPHPLHCEEGGARGPDGEVAAPEATASTAEDGFFSFESITLLGRALSDDWIGLCVEHPQLTRYTVSERWDASAASRFTRFLNIRLTNADTPADPNE